MALYKGVGTVEEYIDPDLRNPPAPRQIEIGPGVVLSNVSVSGADLEGANLRGADLRGVDFYGCSLKYADFRDAKLKNCNFGYADLSGADFRGATLPRTGVFANALVAGMTIDKKHLPIIDDSWAVTRSMIKVAGDGRYQGTGRGGAYDNVPVGEDDQHLLKYGVTEIQRYKPEGRFGRERNGGPVHFLDRNNNVWEACSMNDVDGVNFGPRGAARRISRKSYSGYNVVGMEADWRIVELRPNPWHEPPF